jgi:aminoglycoside phosphotransferase (APT) family kinase protein
MIRQEDLDALLSCMADELQNSIRPAVATSPARKSIDSLLLVLGRMIAEARSGNTIAEKTMPTWRELAEACPLGAAESVAGPLANGLAGVERQIAAIQSRFDPVSHGRMLASLQRGDPAARDWLEASAAALNATLQHYEDGFVRPGARAAESERDIDAERLKAKLSAYLAARYPGLGDDNVEEIDVASGGQVKLTALFRLRPNDLLPRELVLRQDQAFNITGAVVTDEYVVLRQVFDLGLPVPEPILVESDAGILGSQFMIMREIVGAVPSGTYFPEERLYLGSNMGAGFGDDVAGVLARLHRMTEQTSAKTSERGEAAERAAIAEMKAEWETTERPSFSLAIDLGLAWLEANPLPAGRPVSQIHRDVGAHNMMSRDGRLAALLDWELSTIGDPADDLAQGRMMLLPDVMPWPDFADSYVRQGGNPLACDEFAVCYFAVRTYVRHGLMNVRLWNFFTKGERTDAAAASIAYHFIDRLMLYLSRALVMATAATSARATKTPVLVGSR